MDSELPFPVEGHSFQLVFLIPICYAGGLSEYQTRNFFESISFQVPSLVYELCPTVELIPLSLAYANQTRYVISIHVHVYLSVVLNMYKSMYVK